MNNKKHNKRINYSNSLKVAIIFLGTMGRCINAVGYPDANVSRSTRSNRFEVKLAARVPLEETNQKKWNELEIILKPLHEKAAPYTIQNHPAKSTATSGYETKGTDSTSPGSGSGSVIEVKSVPQTNSTSSGSGSGSEVTSWPSDSSKRFTYTGSDGGGSRSQLSNEGDKPGSSTKYYTLRDTSDEEVGTHGICREYEADWGTVAYTHSPNGRQEVYKIGAKKNSRASSAPVPIRYLRERTSLPIGTLSFQPPARR